MSLWIFGYGSLLWKPGFPYIEFKTARLSGYRRSFCMSSIHHRGSPQTPGLVLALDKCNGSECIGLAFQISSENQEKTLAYLRKRELISSAYLEVSLDILDFQDVNHTAVTYIVDQTHEQYCADLTLSRQAAIISTAVGEKGSNAEYLFNTVSKMKSLDIPDAELELLADEVRRILDANSSPKRYK